MKNNNTGAAQSTVIIILSIVTLVLLGFVINFYVAKKNGDREFDKRLSQEIAEEGLTQALEAIKDNPAWNAGFMNVKCREGFYSVSIEKLNDSIYRAQSTGTNRGSKTIILCSYKLEKNDGLLKPKTLNWEYQ
ncbi:MAG: hypothetical protein V1913_08910 [Fibrobacterota bacterium]